MRLLLLSLFVLGLLSDSLAVSYDDAKDALLTLEKLKEDKLITEAEYTKRRAEIVSSIGSEGAAATKKSDEAAKFESRHFAATPRPIIVQKDGSLIVAVEVVKMPNDDDVVLRLNDHRTYPPHDEKEAIEQFESLPINATGDDGTDYKCTNVSGIDFFTRITDIGDNKEPAPLPDKGVTIVTYRLRRIGKPSGSPPKSVNFNAEVCVFTKQYEQRGWSHKGRVNIHFDDLKLPASSSSKKQ